MGIEERRSSEKEQNKYKLGKTLNRDINFGQEKKQQIREDKNIILKYEGQRLYQVQNLDHPGKGASVVTVYMLRKALLHNK